MTIDHVDKYLFNATHPMTFALGRLAMPLFGFVLAYNLARPDLQQRGAANRVACRLLVCGLLASPAFIALGSLAGGLYPLNIMFTLLVATMAIELLNRDKISAAVAVSALGGSMVEFGWLAIGLCIALWCYAKEPTWRHLCMAVCCCAGLQWVNGNAWALTFIPVLAFAQKLSLNIERRRWLFYAYYPLHLSALWLIRFPMRKAGYMFF